MDDKVILCREKVTDYVVNYNNRKFVFLGAKAKAMSKKEVPLEVYEWLSSSTKALINGELILLESDKEKKEEYYGQRFKPITNFRRIRKHKHASTEEKI